MIIGLDISNNNATVTVDQLVPGGASFAGMKVSEGTTFVDATFADRAQRALADGLVVVAYHFVRPSVGDPVAEATFFYRCLLTAFNQQLPPGLVLALDLEDGDVAKNADLSTWTLIFLQTVTQLAGCKPLLYSAPYYLAAHAITGNTAFADYGLWLASWYVANPAVPAPWTFWALWQYSAQGTFPGVSGIVDLDEFNGTADQLRAYGVPAPAPKPAPAFDGDAQYQVVKYIAGGSSPSDLVAWLGQYL